MYPDQNMQKQQAGQAFFGSRDPNVGSLNVPSLPPMGGGSNGRVNVPQALDEQNASIGNLHQVISELEKRLALVLAMEATNASSGPPSPEPSQILDRIGQATRGVNAAAGRIADLLQRLHL